ncbi:MAG: metallophosphoesterase [Gammaproteobacteria bacterium]|nr:metallophosphoesterase [Gammaproteobacteria bacterium]
MTLLVQITDTHIVERGTLLYGMADTARHLAESVIQINAMRPRPDAVLITGDLVEHPGPVTYSHFRDLIEPLEIPVYLMPGNHDDPGIMCKYFCDTGQFPAGGPHYQYAIEDFPIRVLMLNSHFDNSELPFFGPRRLEWLERTLSESDKPTLIAIHHPPMKTGIEFIDMVGETWFREIGRVIERHPQVLKIICGHGHLDLNGQLGRVPVQMVGSIAHQLIAGRVDDVAPSFLNEPVPPMLHHWMDGDLVSGYYAWPADVDAERIDRSANMPWQDLKDRMRGAMKKE